MTPLIKLIDGLITLSDIRGLSRTNPISIEIEQAITGKSFAIIVSITELRNIPLNSSWLVLDSVSPYYKKVLKLKSLLSPTQSNLATALPGLEYTWIEVGAYDEIFTDPLVSTTPGVVQGPIGPQGPQGIQGIPGPQGERGPQGVQGQQGPVGANGPAGPAGAQGTQGPKGDTGSQGPIGLTGPTGLQGPKGDTGAAGPQGLQGPKGDTGATGATGPQGPVGPAGTGTGSGVTSYPFNTQIVGNIPVLVGSINLIAGTYRKIAAEIGCDNSVDIARLEFKIPDGTIMSSIAVTGGTIWSTGLDFIISVDTYVDLVAYGSSSASRVFVRGISYTYQPGFGPLS
jgi:hypothetical protein